MSDANIPAIRAGLLEYRTTVNEGLAQSGGNLNAHLLEAQYQLDHATDLYREFMHSLQKAHESIVKAANDNADMQQTVGQANGRLGELINASQKPEAEVLRAAAADLAKHLGELYLKLYGTANNVEVLFNDTKNVFTGVDGKIQSEMLEDEVRRSAVMADDDHTSWRGAITQAVDALDAIV